VNFGPVIGHRRGQLRRPAAECCQKSFYESSCLLRTEVPTSRRRHRPGRPRQLSDKVEGRSRSKRKWNGGNPNLNRKERKDRKEGLLTTNCPDFTGDRNGQRNEWQTANEMGERNSEFAEFELIIRKSAKSENRPVGFSKMLPSSGQKLLIWTAAP
jgi:hypothetical protein